MVFLLFLIRSQQGITKKSFSKQFAIAETVIVKTATFKDGLLSIELEEILPEEKKAKKIQIS
jgi:molecular chaperone IbpA